MAHKIAELPPAGGGAPTKYPWDQWLDGDPWELTYGEDYLVSGTALARAALDYGTRHNIQVETRQAPGKVFLQAIGVNGE